MAVLLGTSLPGDIASVKPLENTLLPPSHYYVHSGDCADRFYRSAAQGEVVRRLKLKPMCPDCRGGMDLSDPRYPGELERLVKGEKEKEAKKNKGNSLQQLDFRDYVLPSEELEERGSIILVIPRIILSYKGK